MTYNRPSDETLRYWAEEFAVAIEARCGDSRQKIETIKSLRETYGSFGGSIGLKEAKDRIEELTKFSFQTRTNLLLEEFTNLRLKTTPGEIDDVRTPRVTTTSGAELCDFTGATLAQCRVADGVLTIASGDGLTSITFPATDLDGIIEMLQNVLPTAIEAIA